MAEDYRVTQGDCMSSIAFEHGFFWETLWNHARNAGLKEKRKDPNVLLEGDVVHIPDLAVKEEVGATEQRHRFRKRGVPEKLRLVLRDAHGRPRKQVSYQIIVDEFSAKGKTGDDGLIERDIPPNARECHLFVLPSTQEPLVEGTLADDLAALPASGSADENPDLAADSEAFESVSAETDKDKEHYVFSLGGLDPLTEDSGIVQRLVNLGYLCSTAGSVFDDQARKALLCFQSDHGLQPTGEIDNLTRSRLSEIHQDG
jgi:hypothetical protein